MSKKHGVSFTQVKSLLRDANDSAALDAVDQLLGAAALLSPIVFGPAGAIALTLIGPKNELVRVAKAALERVRPGAPFADRVARIEAAYCLNTFAAFFTALDQKLPEISGLLDLTTAEQVVLGSEAASAPSTGSRPIENEVVDRPIALPSVVETITDARDYRLDLYNRMTAGLKRFMSGLASWEKLDSRQRQEVIANIESLPELAEATFVGQHIALTNDFPEYLSWFSFRDSEEQLTRLGQLQQEQRDTKMMLTAGISTLDVGLERLQRLTSNLYTMSNHSALPKSTVVAQELHQIYARRINEPILPAADADRNDLTYPTKAIIFIPQAFRPLLYTAKTISLERESTWNVVEPLEDIGQFVVAHLQTSQSLVTPTIILGQPGSGKSLLTEMLAARLECPAFNTVRVELRDIDADDSIQLQIEKQILASTGRVISWPEFANELVESPPLVILDGFDELLQASGRLHANYIENVQRFQQREFDLKRPVRIIITSRISLINRARVPLGSTVLRLLEFDERRQADWAKIWNQANQKFFASSGTHPFAVPQAHQLALLSEQPLLLLMLALYDSDGNALLQERDLDQSLLYRNLLVRFIEREKTKGEAESAFADLSSLERAKLIEGELDRLGVAALGMFNRNSLHLSKEDLDADLRYFRHTGAADANPLYASLTSADLVVGSFFFVHEATTESGETGERQGSIEFLHNTFGEFLATDFILRRMMGKIVPLARMRNQEDLWPTMRSQMESMDASLASCLVSTPLYTRPVIVSMIREWSRHVSKRKNLSHDDFFMTVDQFVHRQLRFCAAASEGTLSGSLVGTAPQSLLVRCAVMSLNLVVLRVALFDKPLEFSIEPASSGRCTWHVLTHLWQAAFPPEDLVALASVVQSLTEQSIVKVSRVRATGSQRATSRLEIVRDVGRVLADSTMTSLAGLLLWERTGGDENSERRLALIAEDLKRAGIATTPHVELRASWIGSDDWVQQSKFVTEVLNDPLPSPAYSAFIRGLDPAGSMTCRQIKILKPSLGPNQAAAMSQSKSQFKTQFEVNLHYEPRLIRVLLGDMRHGRLGPGERRRSKVLGEVNQIDYSIVNESVIASLAVLTSQESSDWIDWLGEAVDPSALSLNGCLAVAVLSDQWRRQDVCERFLDRAIQQTNSGEESFLDCTRDSLVVITRWSGRRLRRRERTQLDEMRLTLQRTIIGWAEGATNREFEGIPLEVGVEVLRIMSDGLYMKSRLRKWVLGAYSISDAISVRILMMLFWRNDRAGAREFLDSRQVRFSSRPRPNGRWAEMVGDSVELVLAYQPVGEGANFARWLREVFALKAGEEHSQ